MGAREEKRVCVKGSAKKSAPMCAHVREQEVTWWDKKGFCVCVYAKHDAREWPVLFV